MKVKHKTKRPMVLSFKNETIKLKNKIINYSISSKIKMSFPRRKIFHGLNVFHSYA